MKNGSKAGGSKVRYAVVGLGHIAQAAMLPAFKHASRNSVLEALVSDSDKKLKELGRRYRIEQLCRYEDFDELLSSGTIDAVYIALPNDMHKDYVVRSARAGIHVLCEKPMAVTVRDCEAMLRATRNEKIKLMIGYRLHFDRANLQAAQTARSGKLGDLRYFSSDFSMQLSEGNIRSRPASEGGGPLFDIGIYCINAARYSMGADPVAVLASATRSADRRFRNVEETVSVSMRFKDERVASFICSFGAADRSTYTIVGTKGSITVDPAYEYAEGLGYELKLGERTQKKSFAKSDQFAPELLYFSDCILRDRNPEPSGEEGLIDVRIIQSLYKSIRTGRWVSTEVKQRNRRPTRRQEIRKAAVPREPAMVDAHASSQ